MLVLSGNGSGRVFCEHRSEVAQIPLCCPDNYQLDLTPRVNVIGEI